MGEYGKEDNQGFSSLFAFKSGRSDDEAADKRPACSDNYKDRHKIHDPCQVKIERGIFQSGEAKTLSQDEKE